MPKKMIHTLEELKDLQACGWKPDAAERMLKEKFKDFATEK